MLRKAFPLQGSIGGGGISVVQSRFPEGHHARGARPRHHRIPGGKLGGHRQGMNPDAAIYPFRALNHGQHAIKVFRIGAHAQQVRYPRGLGPGDALLRRRV